MLSLCFAVPNEDTNLTAVDLSSSIHAPLAGCDPAPIAEGERIDPFQSTHPLRGATPFVMPSAEYRQYISIHAPLAGCDP